MKTTVITVGNGRPNAANAATAAEKPDTSWTAKVRAEAAANEPDGNGGLPHQEAASTVEKRPVARRAGVHHSADDQPVTQKAGEKGRAKDDTGDDGKCSGCDRPQYHTHIGHHLAGEKATGTTGCHLVDRFAQALANSSSQEKGVAGQTDDHKPDRQLAEVDGHANHDEHAQAVEFHVQDFAKVCVTAGDPGDVTIQDVSDGGQGE